MILIEIVAAGLLGAGYLIARRRRLDAERLDRRLAELRSYR